MTFQNLTHLYKTLVADYSSSLCVFDLDSTLFDVSPRSEKILHEFALENNLPDLKKVLVSKNDWGVYESLLRFGYTKENYEDLHHKLKAYWREKFFSDDYIHYDEPYPGSIHFLQRLEKNQVSIKYLTGRDTYRMEKGTLAVLNKWGLPCSKEHVHLKPHKDMDDELFKVNWIRNLALMNPNKKIYLFENEPVNINAVGLGIPTVKIIFMNTTHSRKQNVNVPHTEIFNYLIERD